MWLRGHGSGQHPVEQTSGRSNRAGAIRLLEGLLRHRGRGPRSRGAVGVADVGGERGGRARGLGGSYMRRDNEASLALYDQEIELHHPVDGSVYRGLDGVRNLTSVSWFDVWEMRRRSTTWRSLIDERRGRWSRPCMSVREGRRSGAAVERREWHGLVVARPASSGGFGFTRRGPRPSKPWGCRSRRCRRRTWTVVREWVSTYAGKTRSLWPPRLRRLRRLPQRSIPKSRRGGRRRSRASRPTEDWKTSP